MGQSKQAKVTEIHAYSNFKGADQDVVTAAQARWDGGGVDDLDAARPSGTRETRAPGGVD